MTLYLVCMTYGEYDDYNSIPVLLTDTPDSAALIAEDLRKGIRSEYFKYAVEAYGADCVPHDVGYTWNGIPLVSI